MNDRSARFDISTFNFRNGELISTFPGEPTEEASYWKAVADAARVRLDRTVEANRRLKKDQIKVQRKIERLLEKLWEEDT